jgi:hypothetical protein
MCQGLLCLGLLLPLRVHAKVLERGAVVWLEEYEEAVLRSREEHKPLLVYFCRLDGEPMAEELGAAFFSHPLVVELIETAFVPLFVDNQANGRDQDILDRFKEIPGNKPVMRILNPDSNVPGERLFGNYSAQNLMFSLIYGLKATGNPVPHYIRLMAKEAGGALPRLITGSDQFVLDLSSREGDPKVQNQLMRFWRSLVALPATAMQKQAAFAAIKAQPDALEKALEVLSPAQRKDFFALFTQEGAP